MYQPRFRYTDTIVNNLQYIASVRRLTQDTALPADLRRSLKHRAQITRTRYSTAIEGNRLSEAEIGSIVTRKNTHKGLPAEQEVLNYWNALQFLTVSVQNQQTVTKDFILKLHSIIMTSNNDDKKGGHLRTPMPLGMLFAVYDSISGEPEYIPPDAKDLPDLFDDYVAWLNSDAAKVLPCIIRAAIASYQLITIHPFEDGNGRLGRALSTYILMLDGYDIDGLLSVEEYYYLDLQRYYASLQLGLPALYYSGRNNPDLTAWLEYFTDTLRQACATIEKTLTAIKSTDSETRLLSFATSRASFTPKEAAEYLGINSRSAARLCRTLLEKEMLAPAGTPNIKQRIRSYRIK